MLWYFVGNYGIHGNNFVRNCSEIYKITKTTVTISGGKILHMER